MFVLYEDDEDEDEEDLFEVLCVEEAQADNGGIKYLQFSFKGELINKYKNLSDIPFNVENIIRCCEGELYTSQGFRWLYVDDYNSNELKSENDWRDLRNKLRKKYSSNVVDLF